MCKVAIPLSAPDITEAEIEAVAAVLRTPRLSLGPKLREFETAMATYVGTPYAVAVSSGTAGLHLALLALGIGAGDEVIVPSFAFIAVANAVLYVGATPVFADIDQETLNVDPACVGAAVTARTRAIIVVHTFGRPAPMAELSTIARQHGLVVIEDACEAIGAEIDGRRLGGFGDVGVFAFYPNKQITTGEGGMVVTRRQDVAQRIAALRNHGRYDNLPPAEMRNHDGYDSEKRCGEPSPESSDAWFEHAELGYNYRLSEMQCALGIAQLARIEEILMRRAAIVQRYCELLCDDANLRLPATTVPGQRLSWFVFVVRLAKRLGPADRARVRQALADEGIATGRYFAPIHRQPAYAPWREKVYLPVTDSVADRTLALPFFNRITDEQVERVCAALRRALHTSG